MKYYYLTALILSLMLISCNSSIVDDPSLVIHYSVPEKSWVKITIENSYNTVVAIPVNVEKESGLYEVIIDLDNFAEGVYYYTIELKGVNSNYYSKTTKHLLLVK